MKLSAIKTNVTVLEQGRWIDDIPEMDDLRLKVRGIGNTDYRRAFDRKAAAVPQAKKIRGLDQEERDRIVGECLVETVLLDWDGLTDENDQPLPYSADEAKRLILDPAFARFRSAVIWAANAVTEDTSEGTKEDLGNS